VGAATLSPKPGADYCRIAIKQPDRTIIMEMITSMVLQPKQINVNL
jgi:hypothetical protein